jgi:hypothetical protein
MQTNIEKGFKINFLRSLHNVVITTFKITNLPITMRGLNTTNTNTTFC